MYECRKAGLETIPVITLRVQHGQQIQYNLETMGASYRIGGYGVTDVKKSNIK